jgi:hypothetical protein
MQRFGAPRQRAALLRAFLEQANDSGYLSKAQYLAALRSVVPAQQKQQAESAAE